MKEEIERYKADIHGDYPVCQKQQSIALLQTKLQYLQNQNKELNEQLIANVRK